MGSSYRVTGDVKAAGLIVLAEGLTYSVGHFLPLGAGTVAVTTVVRTAAGVAPEMAAAVGLLEVLSSLPLSVPLGLAAMGFTARSPSVRSAEEPGESQATLPESD